MNQVTDVIPKPQSTPAPAPTSKPPSPTVGNGTQHTAQVIGLEELACPKIADAKAAPVLANTNPLHGIKAKLQVCVGQTEISVGELIGAKESDVLALDRRIDEAVDLLLNGVVVARGLLVASDGCFAIRVTELPVPLKP